MPIRPPVMLPKPKRVLSEREAERLERYQERRRQSLKRQYAAEDRNRPPVTQDWPPQWTPEQRRDMIARGVVVPL